MKALITGASSGIGRDIAREFAKRNYEIVLVARNVDRLEALKKELENEYKVDVRYLSMDLSVKENCFNLHDNIKDVDVLINNAGFGDFGLFDETDLDKDLNMISTNITCVHILTKLYLKDMKKKDSGKILNVASIAGFYAGPLMATYYATKNYVVTLTEGIREELRREKSNVKVSLLCPGPVDTNFNKTANVSFSLKGMTSSEVAKYAVECLEKDKFYIIPGFGVKCGIFFSRIAPRKLSSKVIYKMQKKKEG